MECNANEMYQPPAPSHPPECLDIFDLQLKWTTETVIFKSYFIDGSFRWFRIHHKYENRFWWWTFHWQGQRFWSNVLLKCSHLVNFLQIWRLSGCWNHSTQWIYQSPKVKKRHTHIPNRPCSILTDKWPVALPFVFIQRFDDCSVRISNGKKCVNMKWNRRTLSNRRFSRKKATITEERKNILHMLTRALHKPLDHQIGEKKEARWIEREMNKWIICYL